MSVPEVLMEGRDCCVANCRRRSHDYRGRKIPNGLTFHCFPTWRRQEGELISRLTKSRRAAWVAAVDRPDITFNHIPTSMRVCSRHFHSGKPAYEMLESDPDWVPSLNLGPADGNTRCTERLLQSLEKDQDQNQRCPAETGPPHETEPETTGGAARPAVRPWREVRSLLHEVLQRKTNFSEQPVKKTNLDFRDFFRNALEASLEASSRSRTLSDPRPSTSSRELNQTCSFSSASSSSSSLSFHSSCLNCERLQRRNEELEEELSRLTSQQKQWMEPLPPPQADRDVDRDVDSAADGTRMDPEPKRKPGRPPRFQKAWLKQFWFLRYSPTLDQMWCHVCQLHADKSHQNVALIRGTSVFRFQSIKQHSATSYHKDCMSRHMVHMCSL